MWEKSRGEEEGSADCCVLGTEAEEEDEGESEEFSGLGAAAADGLVEGWVEW